MDTKYWGPSGWKFLHLITFAKKTNTPQESKNLECFFSTLPYVLPCKFCRSSLSEYLETNPVSSGLESSEPYAFAKWLWKIHNSVNRKLRGQHLHVLPDPPFQIVKKLYTEKFAAGCTRTIFEGWEFLFSIIENHPFSKQSLAGRPIEGAPQTFSSKEEQVRWNTLPPEDRYEMFQQFWRCLPAVLPYKEWTAIWLTAEKTADWSTRKSSLKSLWAIRCAMERELKLLNRTDYSSLCSELRTHRSGCSKSVRAKTCRKGRSKGLALRTYRNKRETR